MKASPELSAIPGGASIPSLLSSAVRNCGIVITLTLILCTALSVSLMWHVTSLRPQLVPYGSAAAAASASAAEDLEAQLVRAERTFRMHLALRDNARQKKKVHGRTFADQLFEELLLAPPYPCVAPVRIGPWGEGGKWVCVGHRKGASWMDPEKSAPVVVSIGSHGQTGFEGGVFEYFGAHSFTFDPFMDRGRVQRVKNLAYVKLFEWGLKGNLKTRLGCDSPVTDTSKHWARLDQVLWLINATYIDIFKIDCECCEYGFVQDLAATYARDKQPLGQIQMELHWDVRRGMTASEDLILTLEGLGYRMFHAEANAYCRTCYEIAFVHESLVTGAGYD